ncbi:MAG: hypothetical protein AAAB20_07835 [Rhizobium sp.]|uniref:hypothetical protein n=1 Tax=Rhizobium sp. TaxID=391 RepID=UPI0030EFEA96
MRWTPYKIKLVLHYHVSSAPFPENSAPIYIPTIDELVCSGVLTKADDFWVTTDLGKALVELWCATPLPVVKYVDPRFDGGAYEA